MKTCGKCGETKPLTDFHRHRREKDGRQPFCKPCQNKQCKPSPTHDRNGNTRRYAKLYPERYAARQAVRWAIQRGDLPKPSICTACGSTEMVEYHHPDYSQQLWVIALCRPCHADLHFRELA